ncbi:MAG: hypothetical protein RI978_1571 [Verrucomicrobiota bacterium]|jgi:hypothetical protein
MKYNFGLLLALALIAPSFAAEKPPVEVTVKLRALSLDGPILGHGYRKDGKVSPLVIAPDFLTQEFTYHGNPHFELLPLTATINPEDIAKLLARHPTGKPSDLSIKTPFAPHTIAKPDGPKKSLLEVGPDPRKSADPRKSTDPRASADPTKTLDPIRSGDPLKSADPTKSADPVRSADPIRSGDSLKASTPEKTTGAQKTLSPEEKRAKRMAAFVPVSVEPPKKPDKDKENKPIAWIDLPTTPGPHHLILLVNPGDPKGGILAIDDAPGAFQYGTIRFYNLCPHPVEIQIPGSRTKIGSKGSTVVRPNAPDGTYFEGAIQSRSAIDDQESLSYSFRYFQQNDLRTLYFIMPSAESEGQVIIKGVEDRYRPPEPAGK